MKLERVRPKKRNYVLNKCAEEGKETKQRHSFTLLLITCFASWVTKISSLSTKRETRPEIKKKDMCRNGCYKNWDQASTIIKLTRVQLTTFISINTNCTVDHSKKPFFPSLLYNWNCRTHFVSFRTVHYKIYYFLFLWRGGE